MGAKVRALLDTAESYENEGNLEAAASYRTKAEELMVKYRVEQEQAIAVDPAVAKPVQRDIVLASQGSKYRDRYHIMWWHIAKHCEVREWSEYKYGEEGYRLTAHAVGYAEDVEYAEMMFTSARLVFAERLEPKIDPNVSDQVNAYRLRASGMERVRVAQALWGNTDKAFLARVGRLYKAECEERGEEAMLSGRGVTGAAYREQYADQFVVTLSNRLWSARQAANASGGGLVLHGRKERINEAFYAFYPEQKPAPALPSAEEGPRCEACARSKRGACREHYIPMGRSSRGPDYNSVAAERGRMAGRAAARQVGINRGGGTKELS
jgi:hypothetical protein